MKPRLRCLLLCLLGLGCHISSDSYGRVAYVATGDPTDNNIRVYSIDNATGKIEGLLQTLPTASGSLRIGVATGEFPKVNGSAYPSSQPFFGKYLYVTNFNNNTISQFRIDPHTGLLTEIASPVSCGGTGPVNIVVERTGRFAYVTNNGSSNVAQFRIGSDGGLSSMFSPVSSGTGAEEAMVHPNNRFLYVPYQSAALAVYRIDPDTGELTELTGSPISTGVGTVPNVAFVHPSGKFLYLTFDGTVQAIAQYSIDQSTGLVSPLNPASLPIGADPLHGGFHASGRFLYFPDNGANNVWQYEIDPATGLLSALIPGTVGAGTTTFDLNLDPADRYAYAVNAGSNNISQFEIDAATGKLREIAPPVSTGTLPRGIFINMIRQ